MDKNLCKTIVCRKCNAVVGLYQYEPGRWICPPCLWEEREKLIVLCENILKEDPETALKFMIASTLSNLEN